MDHRHARAGREFASAAPAQHGAAEVPPSPWLHRSEAFAEDLEGLVTPLPQWRTGVPQGRTFGGLDATAAARGGLVLRPSDDRWAGWPGVPGFGPGPGAWAVG